MAGYSDEIHRRFTKKFGADITFTEMVSVEGFIRNRTETRKLLIVDESQKPVGVQFFGSNPVSMAKAAQMISEFDFEFLDINMGCPVHKVMKHQMGAAMLDNLANAKQVFVAAQQSGLPVSVKVRSGINDESLWPQILEFLIEIEELGAAFVTIHPRTAKQCYSGFANHEFTAEAVGALKIPVIASGDMLNVDNIAQIIRMTDCAGVMIARGATGNFHLFSKTLALLQNREIPVYKFEEVAETIFTFVSLEAEKRGEITGINWCKKFIAQLIKSAHAGKKFANRLSALESVEHVRVLFDELISHTDIVI